MKLIYFEVAARAEASRLILTVGKVPFEDFHVNKDTWPAIKPTTPLGQIPVLQLDDGRMIAQSGAIERYAAKLGGLYPADPIDAAFADQAAFLINDIFDLIVPTFTIPEGDERTNARKALVEGKLKDKLQLLAKTLGTQPYLAGKDMSYADISAFSCLGYLKSGVLDGIPKTLLDEHPVVKDFFQRIASVDAIKARYANATGMRKTYKAE